MTMSDTDATAEMDRGTVIALVPDVFFSVTVRNAIRRIGYQAHMVKTAADLVDALATQEAVLAITDLSAMRDESDWDDISDLVAREIPVLVFGAHRDVEGLRRAKAAGVTRVVANSQFHREMPVLIERYARGQHTDGLVDEIEVDDDPPGSTPPGMTGEDFHERATESSSR
jgi:DNA-binding NtrC family response regulator